MTRDEYIAAAVKANRDMPTGYNRDGWAAGPVGIHRDSDALAISNYRVALREMAAVAGIDPEEIDTMPSRGPRCQRLSCGHGESEHYDNGPTDRGCNGDGNPPRWGTNVGCGCSGAQLETVDLYIGEFGHWAVGWVKEILWRVSNTALGDMAYGLAQGLEAYAVLNEEDYAETQFEEDHPEGDTLCYAEDPESCPCDRISVYYEESEEE